MNKLKDAPSLSAIVDGKAVIFNEINDKFSALVQKWEDYNSGKSVVDFCHFSYLQIIGLGMPAVPMLLGKVNGGSDDWYLALKCITGVAVTTPEMKGDGEAIKDAWLNWGQKHGYFHTFTGQQTL